MAQPLLAEWLEQYDAEGQLGAFAAIGVRRPRPHLRRGRAPPPAPPHLKREVLHPPAVFPPSLSLKVRTVADLVAAELSDEQVAPPLRARRPATRMPWSRRAIARNPHTLCAAPKHKGAGGRAARRAGLRPPLHPPGARSIMRGRRAHSPHHRPWPIAISLWNTEAQRGRGVGRSAPAAPARRALAQAIRAGIRAAAADCPGPPGRVSDLSVFLCKSVFYGAFVWAHRALSSQKRRFPARAGARPSADEEDWAFFADDPAAAAASAAPAAAPAQVAAWAAAPFSRRLRASRWPHDDLTMTAR
jgi:hypothetical protein